MSYWYIQTEWKQTLDDKKTNYEKNYMNVKIFCKGKPLVNVYSIIKRNPHDVIK